ncbi:Ribose-phosphate pyrophosphokinase [Candidatus Burarchaeum australiense]|nr:Ribose-phosphate pyrophosphokinase [Candidatus Burarchaeum australiense]
MKCLFLTTEADAKGFGRLAVKRFPDGDSYVKLPCDVKDAEVVIYSRCYPDQNSRLVELMLAVAACYDCGARLVRAFVPYLPYARQDKRVLEGEAISARTVCQLLRCTGLEELVTFDCHFLKRAGVFEYEGLKIRNLTAAPALLEAAKKGLHAPLVITPDQGAAYLASGERGSHSMKKARGAYVKGSGTAYRKVASLSADFSVKGRDVIIIDDIVAGGSTMLRAVQLCGKGGARRIVCATTHGQFLAGADERIKRAGANRLLATNSIHSKYSAVRTLELARGSL